MPDLAKAEQAFKDLQEQGVFTQKQVDEELELSERRASWDCVRVALTLEEAAKAAEKSGDYTGEKLPKKSDELKAAEKVLHETDDPPKPSFYYGGFEENGDGDEDTCARIADDGRGLGGRRRVRLCARVPPPRSYAPTRSRRRRRRRPRKSASAQETGS